MEATNRAADIRPQNLERTAALVTASSLLITCTTTGVLHVDVSALCNDEGHDGDDGNGRRYWWRVTDRDMRAPLLMEFGRTLELMPTERGERLGMLGRVVGALFAPLACPKCLQRRAAEATQAVTR